MDPQQPNPDTVFEVSPDNFQSGVVERSRQVPVVLLFWAQEVMVSAEVRRDLETLARGYGGKVCVGLVDVARDPTLAQHLRVQGLPSIRVVHDGQIVHQLDGPQTEAALRALLDHLFQFRCESWNEADIEGLFLHQGVLRGAGRGRQRGGRFLFTTRKKEGGKKKDQSSPAKALAQRNPSGPGQGGFTSPPESCLALHSGGKPEGRSGSNMRWWGGH